MVTESQANTQLMKCVSLVYTVSHTADPCPVALARGAVERCSAGGWVESPLAWLVGCHCALLRPCCSPPPLIGVLAPLSLPWPLALARRFHANEAPPRTQRLLCVPTSSHKWERSAYSSCGHKKSKWHQRGATRQLAGERCCSSLEVASRRWIVDPMSRQCLNAAERRGKTMC